MTLVVNTLIDACNLSKKAYRILHTILYSTVSISLPLSKDFRFLQIIILSKNFFRKSIFLSIIQIFTLYLVVNSPTLSDLEYI